MGRGNSGGYAHRIRRVRADVYLIAWSFDVVPKGRRFRLVKRGSQETNRAGAECFAKKWDIKMPEDPI